MGAIVLMVGLVVLIGLGVIFAVVRSSRSSATGHASIGPHGHPYTHYPPQQPAYPPAPHQGYPTPPGQQPQPPTPNPYSQRPPTQGQ